ncbi:hypothetical protein [Pedobacter sp. MC2016-24]|uniref:hypothetical protein n=1 Tax=Pedobacter sp. MC2016-24 TaxID=2780090 RepID=UPI00187E44CB|nr:hypothetical protein [Pedobacter sp. MC2016-24]MBE9598747.1 hypothetical protein [Pedobacter sp. MC2016-24]
MPTLITKYRSAVTDTTGLLRMNEVKFTLEQMNSNTSGRLKVNLPMERTGTITLNLTGGASIFEKQVAGEWVAAGTNISIDITVQDTSQYFRIKVLGISTLTVGNTEFIKYWGIDASFLNMNNGGSLFGFDNYGDNAPNITTDLSAFFTKINTFSYNGSKLLNLNQFKNSRLEHLAIGNATAITDLVTNDNFPNLKKFVVSSTFKTANPISKLPVSLAHLEINNSNLSGDFSIFKNASTPLVFVRVMSPLLTLTNLSNLPRSTNTNIGLEAFFNDYNGGTWKNCTYTGGFNWPNNMNRLVLGGFVLNAASMDILLNELAAINWFGDGRKLSIQGRRTSASDAAITQLQEKEVLVTILTKDQV